MLLSMHTKTYGNTDYIAESDFILMKSDSAM